MAKVKTKGLSKVISTPNLRSFGVKIDTVTPAKFKQAYLAAQSGSPGLLWDILNFFKQLDGHLAGDIQRRYSAVTANKPSIITEDEKDEDWIEVIRQWHKELDYKGLAQELLLGFYFGARAIELEWEYRTILNHKLYLPVSWNKLPSDFVYAKKKKGEKYSELYVGNQRLADYPPGKILLYLDAKFESYKDIDFTQIGKGLAAIRFSIYKYFDYDDWAAFNEIYAQPFRKGHYDPNTATKDDISVLEQAVHDMGTDGSAVMAEGTDIDLIEAQRQSSVAAYEKLKDACNQEISQALLSQSVTSSSGKFGTYGAHVSANGISLDVAQSDAQKLDAIMEDLTERVLNINGHNVQLTIQSRVPKARDLGKEVSVDKAGLAMGVDMSKAQMRKKYGWEEPIDDDDSLTGRSGATLLP